MYSPNAASLYRSPQHLPHAQALSDEAARLPPSQRVVGNVNTTLNELQDHRNELGSTQSRLVEAIEQFHADRNVYNTNMGLGFLPVGVPVASLAPHEFVAMRRRGSFMLNKEAIDALPAVLPEVMQQTGASGTSNATRSIGALATSVKSQCEKVNAVAVADAQEGLRICPTTLLPAAMTELVRDNAPLFSQMTQVCSRAGAARDAAMKPLLEQLAAAYFAVPRNDAGAPQKPPHAVNLIVGTTMNSHLTENWQGKKIANLCIDTTGLDDAGSVGTKHVMLEDRPHRQLHAMLLQGFEQLSPEKKRAVLYAQMLLQEASEIQELMGAASAGKPTHPPATQRAAQGTMSEWMYTGLPGLGDNTQTNAAGVSQRRAVLDPVVNLPIGDVSFRQTHGTSMIKDQRIRAWVHSPQFPADLRALAEPSARLMLQVPPATAAALRGLPVFQR